MVTIEPYNGDACELAKFASDVWRTSYQGKMTFPVWSAEYFNWQFRLDDPNWRDYTIAAYDGSRLAGVLLGVPHSWRTPQRIIPGSIWSWLSIHPDYRGQRLAVQLDEERVRRMRAIGTDLVVSYRFFGSNHSQAERPKANLMANKFFLRKIGFWIRILDPVKMWHWDLRPMHSLGALLSYPVAGIPGPGRSAESIQSFKPDDLDGCEKLLACETPNASLAVAWPASELRQQLLGSSLSRSLVFRKAGQVAGLINFHLLPIQGRTLESVGVVDIVAVSQLTHLERVRFINSALAQMRQLGAVIALKLNTGDVPAPAMFQSRWMPQPADSHLVLQWTGTPEPVQPDLPLHLLWR